MWDVEIQEAEGGAHRQERRTGSAESEKKRSEGATRSQTGTKEGPAPPAGGAVGFPSLPIAREAQPNGPWISPLVH